MSIADKIMTVIFGSKHERDIKELLPIVQKVNEKESWAASLNENQFHEMTEKFSSKYTLSKK